MNDCLLSLELLISNWAVPDLPSRSTHTQSFIFHLKRTIRTSWQNKRSTARDIKDQGVLTI
jgi:hypothetical protein